jgi:hypothetical protein
MHFHRRKPFAGQSKVQTDQATPARVSASPIEGDQSMISKFHFFAAALAGVLVCCGAGAQVRNGSSFVRRSSARVRPGPGLSANSMHPAATGFQPSPQASSIQISPRGRITSGFDPVSNSFSFDNFSGVPGLGFDFPHLAAIGGAPHDHFSHFRHDGHRGQVSFVPIFFGGYPYGYGDLGYDQQDQQTAQPSQPQPQIIVIQQPVPAQQGTDSGSGTANLPPSEPESQAAAPIPDVGDFILVRRDGRLLFASAFSVVGAQLQYVTREGFRHTLAMSDLDAAATERMNEAAGTTVQIHK